METINISEIVDNFLGSATDEAMVALLESAREECACAPDFDLRGSSTVVIPVDIQGNLEEVFFNEASPSTFRLNCLPFDHEDLALAA